MRATTIFTKLLNLTGVWVTGVEFGIDHVIVDVRLKRRHLICPVCGWSTASTHNSQQHASSWRALDMGIWQVTIRCRLRRLHCRPCNAVIVEQVPFARYKARFTADFDDLIGWLASRPTRPRSLSCAVSTGARLGW